MRQPGFSNNMSTAHLDDRDQGYQQCAGDDRLGKGAASAIANGVHTMKVKIAATLLILGLVLLGWAEADAGASDRILRFGVNVSKMGRLDPHFAAAAQDRAVADMVFNGLLRYQPGNAPRMEPDLAERIPEFKMHNGRQVWTVPLRKGVMFHSGPQSPAHEMTAEDVVFSFRKAAENSSSAYSGEYAGMTFEAVGDYTVIISLDRPLSTVLFLPKIANYGGGFIVSKRAVEAAGMDGFQRHPVGTGPFRFAEYIDGEKVALTAHENYFRGSPRLAGIEIHFAPDDAQRAKDLVSDRLDVIIASGETGWIDRMKNEKDIVINPHGVGELAMVLFNTKMAPLDDIRVRQALAHALDKDALMTAMDPTFVGGPAYSPVPALLLPGGLHRQEAAQLGLIVETDLAKAKGLLASAGYPDGFTLKLVSSEKRIYHLYYSILRDNLARIGIICDIEFVPHAEMHRRIRQEPQAIVVYAAWRPNADVYLTRFFHSDSIVVTGARPDTNFSHYDKVDNLIEAARSEINPDRQISLWIQAQIRILNDVAVYPIMTTNQCYLRRASVQYGHPLVSSMALYPQFTEKTRFIVK